MAPGARERRGPRGKVGGSDFKFKTIKQKVMIDATPAEVYDAYTDPRKHAAFTGDEASGTPKVGGKFTASSGYIKGEYVELVRGRKIVHWWTTTEWPGGYPPSLMELRLQPKGRKTELTMIHSRVPAEQADRYAEGWQEYYWRPLQGFFSVRS
ncbi:MAG: SRPBCC domain-containing protein [Thaumarchaeota archaeon]|nr:SRPBCC domain-containing protein [Nitrososphaerota archaeon]